MLSKKLPYWNKAITHLKQNDKILAKIISSHHKDYLIINNQYFISLIKAIIGQQISVKAAQSIWIRGCKFCNKKKGNIKAGRSRAHTDREFKKILNKNCLMHLITEEDK